MERSNRSGPDDLPKRERERELENINFVVPFLVLVCKEQGRCISYLDFCIITQEYSERAQGG